MQPVHRVSTVRILFAALVLSMMAKPMLAHAILLESSPAANAKISNPYLPIKLRFNVRIDLSRSRLILVRPDGSQQALTIKKDTPADIVAADAAALAPGAYRLRWQVLASDGHITRGEVLFTVVGA
jgi:methionine-rich copper-binding protein CopC